MPLSKPLTAKIIVISDYVIDGVCPDEVGPAAVELLATFGVDVGEPIAIPENKEAISVALKTTIEQGYDIIITAGGVGLKPNNLTPEATRPFLDAELPGIATQVLLEGIKNDSHVGLARGLVGVTGRNDTSALVVNSAGCVDGITDTITVIGPLLSDIFQQLGRS